MYSLICHLRKRIICIPPLFYILIHCSTCPLFKDDPSGRSMLPEEDKKTIRKSKRIPAFVKVAKITRGTIHLSLKFILPTVTGNNEKLVFLNTLPLASLLRMYLNDKVNEYTIRGSGTANLVSVTSKLEQFPNGRICSLYSKFPPFRADPLPISTSQQKLVTLSRQTTCSH